MVAVAQSAEHLSVEQDVAGSSPVSHPPFVYGAVMSTTSTSLPNYISLSEAVARLDLSEARLQDLIRVGTLKAIRIKGETVVDEKRVEEIATKPKKEELEEYKQFAHLAGEKISISDASRKYGVRHQTLSLWMKQGHINRLSNDGYRVYINEQDVAYCSFIYEMRGGQGKRIFNSDGTPYQTKAELAKLKTEPEQAQEKKKQVGDNKVHEVTMRVSPQLLPA